MEQNSTTNLLIYVLREVARSFFGFFSDWYIRAPKVFWKKVMASYKSWERQWAMGIMVRNWFSPLYQDYTILGYFIGVIFRTLRIFLALLFYAFFFAGAGLLLLAWLLLPAAMVWMMLVNLT